MSEQTSELSRILARLERVEGQNRRLKQLLLITLLLIGAVFLMGQTRSNRIVEAEKFVLKDAKGKERAKLEMDGDKPTLSLLSDEAYLSLAAGKYSVLTLCDSPYCKREVQVVVSHEVEGLTFYEGGDWPGSKGDFSPQRTGLRAGVGVVNGVPGFDLFGKAGESASLTLDSVGPHLVLTDAQGFNTTIGGAELETPRIGETHKTSAASIVLFGKDQKVLWSAP